MECPICFITEEVSMEMDCTHKLCMNCYQQWFDTNHTCPVCRTVHYHYGYMDNCRYSVITEMKSIFKNAKEEVDNHIFDNTPDTDEEIDTDEEPINKDEIYVHCIFMALEGHLQEQYQRTYWGIRR